MKRKEIYKAPETERRQTIEPQILRTQRTGQQRHSLCLSYTCGQGAGVQTDRHNYCIWCAECSADSAVWTLWTVQCTVWTVQCSVQCGQCSVQCGQCSVDIVDSAVCSVDSVVCSEDCAVYSVDIVDSAVCSVDCRNGAEYETFRSTGWPCCRCACFVQDNNFLPGNRTLYCPVHSAVTKRRHSAAVSDN